LRRLLNNADFVIRQAVELADELVDLAVGGVDLTLDGRLVRWRLARVRPASCCAARCGAS